MSQEIGEEPYPVKRGGAIRMKVERACPDLDEQKQPIWILTMSCGHTGTCYRHPTNPPPPSATGS